jgi:hypothetical protein
MGDYKRRILAEHPLSPAPDPGRFPVQEPTAHGLAAAVPALPKADHLTNQRAFRARPMASWLRWATAGAMQRARSQNQTRSHQRCDLAAPR